MSDAIEKGAIRCANCGKREATKRWVGDGGVLSVVHGFVEMWCEVCVLAIQIEHAEECAARLPGMRARLEAIS